MPDLKSNPKMSSSTEATPRSQDSITGTSATTRLELVVPTAAVSIDPDPAPILAVEHMTMAITTADLLTHGLPTTSISQTNTPEFSVSPGIPRYLENYSPPRYNGPEMPFVGVEAIPSDCPPPIPVEVITPYNADENPPRDLSEEVDFDMPQWFLDNCVMTAEQLRKKEVNLLIRSGEEDDHLVPKGSEMYEVEPFVYEPLRAISTSQDERTETGYQAFKFDAVYLRYPAKVNTITYYPVRHAATPPEPTPPVPDGTNAFLSVLVEQFAKDCGADMITLTLADLRDLVAEFTRSQGMIYAGFSINYELFKAYVNHASSDSAVAPLPCVDPDGFPMPWREETRIGVSEEVDFNAYVFRSLLIRYGSLGFLGDLYCQLLLRRTSSTKLNWSSEAHWCYTYLSCNKYWLFWVSGYSTFSSKKSNGFVKEATVLL